MPRDDGASRKDEDGVGGCYLFSFGYLFWGETPAFAVGDWIGSQISAVFHSRVVFRISRTEIIEKMVAAALMLRYYRVWFLGDPKPLSMVRENHVATSDFNESYAREYCRMVDVRASRFFSFPRAMRYLVVGDYAHA